MDILEFINELEIPLWMAAGFPVLLGGVIVYLFWFIRTRFFKIRLKKIVNAKDKEQSAQALKFFRQHYPAEKLLRYSRRMERYSKQMGPEIVQKIGLADKWIQKLSSGAMLTVTDIRRVLQYCPKSAVFKAFIAASLHNRLKNYFLTWMEKEGEEKVIRLLAETCRGEDFDPVSWKLFLEKHASLFRELTAETEWYARYFAYKILIQDKDALDDRGIEAGLSDPHPLIRKILTEQFSAERFFAEKEKSWNILWDKLIHDPVFEVRKAARKRISKDYTELYSLKDKIINADETFRILELMESDCQEDKTFAMSVMKSDNKELRYPAAVYLFQCGSFSSMLSKNTLDDPNNIEHSYNILKLAMEVNVSDFLNDYPSGDGAPLLVAARLLAEKNGTSKNIVYLVKKVFNFFSTRKLEPSIKEIYLKTLEAIVARENMEAYRLLKEELIRRENDPVFLDALLPNLPVKAESVFAPILFNFLKNEKFLNLNFTNSFVREYLIKILGNFKPDIVLPEAFRILNADRFEYSHEVRICALRILGQLKVPFCLQRILESLPTLRQEEMEDFAKLISEYPESIFEEKVKNLFSSPDAKIRASLITILPVTNNKSFVNEIRSSLKDVDPDVRVSAIKSLLGFGEIKLLNQETSMLRDPVERVRLATAEVIARHGNSDALDILKTIIYDPNETDIVKIGVINGLGQAMNAEGISILVSILESEAMDEFKEHATQALAKRIAKRDILKILEIFKDAEPLLREKLIPVFKTQGKEAEPFILEILKDEVASLKPYLVNILEETGFIDDLKRRLSNRSIEVRREAAALLSLMDTIAAFRSLVLAAKDPDQEVRISVVKALEKLQTSHSREILEKLKHDPDTRIRKYTRWALERLDSLAME